MVHHGAGLHHLHKRVRDKRKLTKTQKWMDRLVYVGAVVGPLLTLPQILKVWIGKSAAGLSLISWASYLVGAVFWLAYGIVHKEKPIIVTFAGWIVVYALVIVGIVIYG